ncbi:MAG: class I SAM-dependent methyltransferase [Phaeodactylibacter sp.]|nr:class I SAM-dependent methyltransferase [Phaeodactylibacter sp.]MCB9297798.1 class I SAM-dependent methyltransferase [Lewinellaceae bacterium]
MNWIAIHLRLVWKYLQYYRRAETRYGLHSPFVYELVEKTLEDKRTFYAFPIIESLRGLLLRDDTRIAVADHGAGSKVEGSSRRTVRSLARHSAVSPATGRLLFRLVHFIKPATLLELGTSLGISTAYQAAAALHAPFITIEGCPATAALAQQHLRQLNLPNVQLLAGTFREKLPEALRELKRLDYLYLDGDHRRGATLEYFGQCLPYAHAGSVFVIADIYWSAEMEEAWAAMRSHPRVSLSVDLFHLGLLFFREEQREQEHFTVVRSGWKPWRMGFFG